MWLFSCLSHPFTRWICEFHDRVFEMLIRGTAYSLVHRLCMWDRLISFKIFTSEIIYLPPCNSNIAPLLVAREKVTIIVTSALNRVVYFVFKFISFSHILCSTMILVVFRHENITHGLRFFFFHDKSIARISLSYLCLCSKVISSFLRAETFSDAFPLPIYSTSLNFP